MIGAIDDADDEKDDDETNVNDQDWEDIIEPVDQKYGKRNQSFDNKKKFVNNKNNFQNHNNTYKQRRFDGPSANKRLKYK